MIKVEDDDAKHCSAPLIRQQYPLRLCSENLTCARTWSRQTAGQMLLVFINLYKGN